MEAKDETFLAERIQLVQKTPRPDKPGVQLFLHSPGRPLSLKSLKGYDGKVAMLTCTLSATFSQEQVTPASELGTAKGSMTLAGLASVPKAATTEDSTWRIKGSPFPTVIEILRRGFLLKHRGDVQTLMFGANITKHVCNQCVCHSMV